MPDTPTNPPPAEVTTTYTLYCPHWGWYLGTNPANGRQTFTADTLAAHRMGEREAKEVAWGLLTSGVDVHPYKQPEIGHE